MILQHIEVNKFVIKGIGPCSYSDMLEKYFVSQIFLLPSKISSVGVL